MILPEKVNIRPFREEDLESIVEIEEASLWDDRWSYWEKRLRLLSTQLSQISLVAEMEGQMVGVILGDVSDWEFGVPDTIGWIETIHVKPSCQQRGVATALVRELIEKMKRKGVKKVYTLVNWDDWDLVQFFHSMGFTKGEMIHLELRI